MKSGQSNISTQSNHSISRWRWLIFMTANPFHYGHLALVEETLEKCPAGCDIYLWNRAKEWTLPHQVRISALRNTLSSQWLMESTGVIFNTNERTGSILEIPSENYDLLAMGSDIANSINPISGRLREYERKYFLSFANMLVLERPSTPISESSKVFLRSKIRSLTILSPRTDLSATHIRSEWMAGRNIENLLPAGVYEEIEPYLSMYWSKQESLVST